MKQYKIEPINYTNDFPTKIITCKRITPNVFKKLYGLDCTSIKGNIAYCGYIKFLISCLK